MFLESSTTKDISLNEYQGKAVKTINRLFKVFDSLSSHKQFNEINFVKKIVDRIQQTATFPEIPVFIITGGQENRMMPEEIRKKRLENQLELLSLSRNSKQIVAKKSGHFPQLSEPIIVIDSIKDCAEQLNKTNHN
ncbi:hypothetical protein [Peribacillus simplex]|uniref:hypothetical protein n=1 Tax=Peribacillus simplex TaxID=1478 RepID=UPI0033352C36